jgi:hypothetical protein
VVRRRPRGGSRTSSYGSEASARRFAEIQAAYEEVRARPRPARPNRAAEAADSVKERMATLERELREAHAARERARRAAREAVDDGAHEPDADTTEDSFGKILGDIRVELADRISEGRRHPAAQRVSELIDDVVSRLDRH